VTDDVLVSREGGVMEIRFNRPDKKNALTGPMYQAIGAAMAEAETDDSVRAVLFTAAGDAFSAGNDVGDFAKVAATGDRSVLQAHLLLYALVQAQKPLVAAVNGLAVGVGTTMLLHCDLVYVAEDAKLTTPFVNLALVPEAASSILLPERIGHTRAFAMFALGEAVSGRQAADWGIANAALPAADVIPAARRAAQMLAQKPLGAVMASKKLMRDSARLRQRMEDESEIFRARLESAEAREAFTAFAQRRAPDFSKAS
jgi:enoyl-CoA hydratase/carnithine racemase